MKKKEKINTLREIFKNDKDFIEALDDALILENLKNPTKFSIEVEDLEEKMNELVQAKNKFTFRVLFANYKRYFYKHVLEIEKEKDK